MSSPPPPPEPPGPALPGLGLVPGKSFPPPPPFPVKTVGPGLKVVGERYPPNLPCGLYDPNPPEPMVTGYDVGEDIGKLLS